MLNLSKYFLTSKRDSLTVIALACHAARPGSNLGKGKSTSFFFRLRGGRMRNDCGKIERIAIAIATKQKARREHETLP